MKIYKFITVLLVFILIFLFFGKGVVDNGEEDVNKGNLVISTTIFPLFDIVKNIIGNKGEVNLILKPGASPHTFNPTPEDIRNIAKSDVVFFVGHGLDDWVQSLVKGLGEDVNLQGIFSGIDIIEGNPHYWLSLDNAIIITANIVHILSRIDPDNSEYYLENSGKYIKDLRGLQNKLMADLEDLDFREIATFHNAWQYFAEEFNLNVIATFEEYPGKEPAPKYLAEFQDKIRKYGIKNIFSEPQLSMAALEPVIEDMGVKITILDPIGGVTGRESYIELMKFNATQILKSRENNL